MPTDLWGTVGVTAGASAPEELVDAVITRLAPANGVEIVSVTDEDEYFPPPGQLRELLPAIAAVAALGLYAPIPTSATFQDDRATAASDVLAGLAD